MRIMPGATIFDLPVEHPIVLDSLSGQPAPQIPSLGSSSKEIFRTN